MPRRSPVAPPRSNRRRKRSAGEAAPSNRRSAAKVPSARGLLRLVGAKLRDVTIGLALISALPSFVPSAASP